MPWSETVWVREPWRVTELHPREQQHPAPWGSIGKPPSDAEQVGRVRRGASGVLGTGCSHEVPRRGNAAVSASLNPKKPLCSQPFGSYFSWACQAEQDQQSRAKGWGRNSRSRICRSVKLTNGQGTW